MTDRIFLRLNDKWALADDSQQGVVLKAEKRHRRAPWRAVSFIGSTKDVLLRVVGEKGIKLTPEARAAPDALPDTFKQWRRSRTRRAKIERAA